MIGRLCVFGSAWRQSDFSSLDFRNGRDYPGRSVSFPIAIGGKSWKDFWIAAANRLFLEKARHSMVSARARGLAAAAGNDEQSGVGEFDGP